MEKSMQVVYSSLKTHDLSSFEKESQKKKDIIEVYSISYLSKSYMVPLLIPYSTTYLQAGGTTYGMWTNTMENGPTIIGCDEFTNTGSMLGMFPDESKFKAFPLSSMVWLCMFPSFGVRWYSSLSVSPLTLSVALLRPSWCFFRICDL